jgi:hypothetical protein
MRYIYEALAIRCLAATFVFSFFISNGVHAGDKQFITWWESFDETMQVRGDYQPAVRRMKTLSFDSLKEYQGPAEISSGIGKDIEKALVLYSTPNMILLLVTPKNIMGNKTMLNEEFRQTMVNCAGDRSWIVMLPENAWTEIDLNPYCTMDYGEENIRIDLLWPRFSSRPFVDIITGGLLCTPHQLLGWDTVNRTYRPVSRKCTGVRAMEGYSGIYWRLLLPGPAPDS